MYSGDEVSIIVIDLGSHTCKAGCADEGAPNVLFLSELIEKLSKDELPKNEYQCMNEPSPTVHGTSQSASLQSSPVHANSMRSRRTATWARPRNSDDGYSS